MRSVFGWSVLSIAMLFASMSASNRANAGVGLNLVVDSTTKTLWFDGSDSGTLVNYGIEESVSWGNFSLVQLPYLDTSSAAIFAWTGRSPQFPILQIGFNDPDIFIRGGGFFEDGPSDGNWNFTGKGSSASISYAGLSSAFQSRLESLATSNTQLSVTTGTAGNSLKMSLFSSGGGGGGQVPEPTSMAIFGLGALGFAYRARRKSKA